MNYLEKLKDPRWQKIRLEIFQRDNWTCQSCGEITKTLHVHHWTYEKGLEPWDYPLEELVTLCESCHEEETLCRADLEQCLLENLREANFMCSDIANLFGLVGTKTLTRNQVKEMHKEWRRRVDEG